MSDRRARWIAISVDLLNHPVVGASARRQGGFTHLEAWLWLLARAAYRTHPIGNGKRTMTVERGQLPVGREYLAKEWGWGTQKVRLFLNQLVCNEMAKITQQGGRLPNVLTICNYEKYQTSDVTVQPAKEPLKNQQEPKNHPHMYKDSTKDTEKNPPIVPLVQKPSGKSQAQVAMQSALSPQHAEAHSSVAWDSNWRLTVNGTFRPELLAQVKGDEIILQQHLDEAAGSISRHLTGIDLMLAVRRQFARQVRFSRERKEALAPKKSPPASLTALEESIRDLAECRKRDEAMGLVLPRNF